MKQKLKQTFSLVMTSAVLFSSMGMTATADLIVPDTQPTILMDTESEPMLVMSIDESEEKTEEKAESELDSGEENEVDPDEDSGEENEVDPDENSGEENEVDPDEDSGEENEVDPDEDSGEENEVDPDEDSGEENEVDPDENSGEENEVDPDENSEEKNEENFEKDSEENPEEDLLEDSEEESSADPETSETKPSIDLIPDAHEHTWSVDWSYDGACHWHECDVEDCPAVDNSEKNGYAEHNYDDFGVCTTCSYNAMDGIAAVAQGTVPSYQEAYMTMIALQDKYPEGMTWTNFEPYGSEGDEGSAYTWKGGAIYGAKSAVGCMAFAFILSDAVFDNLPARAIERGKFTFEDVKVGDILRVEGNSHSVIVLQKSAGGVTVAEGNYKKTVHWGRAMSVSAVEKADFIITRYPKNYVPSDDLDDTVDIEGTEDGLHWSLSSQGVLTISGNGVIPDYSENPSPWDGYDFYTVVIEDGVTGIGDSAFYQSEMISMYIPDSVTTIGQNAFRESALMAVTIPGTVRTIGDHAFRGCKNLTSVTVSDGVTTIGDFAFHGCTTLAYIDFPASIQSVGAGAFESCSEMVSVRFVPGKGNVTLGDGLFRQCWHLTTVTLPQTADSISAYMFQSCGSLSSLYIPASIQHIGENPFTSCNALKVIYFGGSKEKWDSIAPQYLKDSLASTNTTVVYDAVFEDPFATAPDDPGDFLPDKNEPCTDHVDADKDGICDICGEAISGDNPEPDNDNEDDKTDPDDDEKNPVIGNGNNRPSTDSYSGSSGGSSGDSSDESNKAGALDELDNPAISATIQQGLDGSQIITKTHKDGTIVTITTDATGKEKTEVKLSLSGIHTAQQNGRAVDLPIPAVPVVKDIAMAPAITVHTEKDQFVQIAIPTVLPTAGTVAVIVNRDGSTNVIKNSVPAKNCVVVSLPNGATVKIVDNSKSFSDVPAGSWFWNAASFSSARDLFYDTAESTFAPDAPMTYAMMTTALARFDGVQTDDGTTSHEKSMEWAAARGIKDETNPDSNITGEQLMTMLWKYQGSPATTDTPSSYREAGPVSDTQKALHWVTENDVLSGLDNGTFEPQKQISRAQAAQIIMNFAKSITLHSLQ